MNIKQDIAQWEKAKSELEAVKSKVPEIAKSIFPETLKASIETELKNSLKAILETM